MFKSIVYDYPFSIFSISLLENSKLVSGSDQLHVFDDNLERVSEISVSSKKNVFSVYQVLVSIVGNFVATNFGHSGNEIRIWDVSGEGSVVHDYEGKHDQEITSMVVMNENLLVSVSYDRSIKYFELQPPYHLLHTMKDAHKMGITCSHRYGSERIVTSGYDKVITIWNCLTYNSVQKIRTNHENYIQELCVTPKGMIVSSSFDGTCKFWNEKSGKCMKTINVAKSAVSTIRNFGVSHLLLGTIDGGIQIWEIQENRNTNHSKKEEIEEEEENDEISPESPYFDIKRICQTDDEYTHREMITGFVCFEDGRFLSSSRDGKIKQWIFEDIEKNETRFDFLRNCDPNYDLVIKNENSECSIYRFLLSNNNKLIEENVKEVLVKEDLRIDENILLRILFGRNINTSKISSMSDYAILFEEYLYESKLAEILKKEFNRSEKAKKGEKKSSVDYVEEEELLFEEKAQTLSSLLQERYKKRKKELFETKSYANLKIISSDGNFECFVHRHESQSYFRNDSQEEDQEPLKIDFLNEKELEIFIRYIYFDLIILPEDLIHSIEVNDDDDDIFDDEEIEGEDDEKQKNSEELEKIEEENLLSLLNIYVHSKMYFDLRLQRLIIKRLSSQFFQKWFERDDSTYEEKIKRYGYIFIEHSILGDFLPRFVELRNELDQRSIRIEKRLQRRNKVSYSPRNIFQSGVNESLNLMERRVGVGWQDFEFAQMFQKSYDDRKLEKIKQQLKEKESEIQRLIDKN